MDIPIHVAAAAVACQAVLFVENKWERYGSSRHRDLISGAACFIVGVAAHLFLDALPHYGLLYKYFSLPRSPWILHECWTVIKVSVLIAPIILLFLYLTPGRSRIALLAIFGGIFPDIEKVAYLTFDLPRALVLFPHHSCSFSPIGWEIHHPRLVTISEASLFIVLPAAMCWLAFQRTGQRFCYSEFVIWCRSRIAMMRFMLPDVLEHSLNLKRLTGVYALILVSIFLLSDFNLLPQPHALVRAYVPRTPILEYFPHRIPYDDKIAHFLMIGALALCVNLTLAAASFSIGKFRILKGSAIVLIFMTLEELSQAFFPSRQCSWGDLLANYAGVLCFGQMAMYVMSHRTSLEPKFPHLLSMLIWNSADGGKNRLA